MNITWFNELFD